MLFVPWNLPDRLTTGQAREQNARTGLSDRSTYVDRRLEGCWLPVAWCPCLTHSPANMSTFTRREAGLLVLWCDRSKNLSPVAYGDVTLARVHWWFGRWHKVVIFTWFALFLTSRYDFLFASSWNAHNRSELKAIYITF